MSLFISLTRALRLDRYKGTPIVSIVGGGGKTTTMFMLARELATGFPPIIGGDEGGAGKRVVTTTTTRLFASQRAQSPAWCAADDLGQLSRLLDKHGQCLVTAADTTWQACPEAGGDGKARGIPAALVAQLAARQDVDAVLVEADGSRKRPFKAPASHEPVIPIETTHVVAVVGADIFGKLLTAQYVHRPERVMALTGVTEGTPVSPELVARILSHPEGGLRNVPHSAAFIPFINKVEDEKAWLMAQETARLLLREERVCEVVVGSLHRLRRRGIEQGLGERGARRGGIEQGVGEKGALERYSRGAAVILAAGMAKRFGRTKQLLAWKGKPLVRHVAEVAVGAGLAPAPRLAPAPVLVIVGHEAEAVAQAVEDLPVEVIYNEQFASGQGSSVAAGAQALLEPSRPFIGEAFFMLADQPLITPQLLQQLQQARGMSPIAVPRYQGKRGNPVLFDRALLETLTSSSGDVGGRALFKKYRDEIAWVEVEDEAVLRDVDTEEDWERLKGSI
jgi:molybdenum cofactor cytidylyltransferase